MKKRYFIYLIIFFSVFILYCQLKSSDSPKKRVRINNKEFLVEIADTEEKRIKGLSGKEKLAQNEGMLFIFPTSSSYPFWMKDMEFSLDFIWINNKQIVDKTENISPVKNTANQTIETFTASVPFDMVLEINAGIIRQYQLNIGDYVIFE